MFMDLDYTDQSVYNQPILLQENFVKHESAAIRRTQILDAASHCIAEQGFERATMDDIARAANLSKGSLYWHYANKSAILQALLERFAEDLIGRYQGRAQSEPSLAVIEQGQEALQAFVSNRNLLEIWVELLHHCEAREQMAQLYAQVRHSIAKAIGKRAQIASAGLVALMEGLLVQATMDPSFDPVPVWRRIAPRVLSQ